MSFRDDLKRRAAEYCQLRGLVLGDELGSGVHGTVFVTESQPQKGLAQSAIKAHHHEPSYWRERDVYLRLKELGLNAIRGCHVPKLLAFDDTLLIIEMTIVTRPFVLDFAGAYLDDAAPDFSDEVMADWEADKREQFEARWPEVQAILRALQVHGIHMLDVNPGNISFAE